MQEHIIVYHEALDIPLTQDCQNERLSELGGGLGVDIHHIERKGAGGSKTLDRIENLMALTREQHKKYGDKKQYKSFLYIQHEKFLQRKGIKYDKEWITNQINKNKHYEY